MSIAGIAAAQQGSDAPDIEGAGLFEQDSQPDAPMPTLADLQALLAKVEATGDPAARHELLVQAVVLYDRLSLAGSDALGSFDGAAFVGETAAAYLAYAESLPSGSDAQESVLSEARDLLPRIRDTIRQADFYITLARIEMATGDAVDGMAAIRKASGLVVTLPEGSDRDRVRVALVRLALPLAKIDLPMKFGWGVTIDDPHLARDAMRAVALAEIASGRAGKQLFKLAGKEAADRDGALRDFALAQFSNGNLSRALVAALAIDDAHSVDRDATLARLMDRQIERGARPEDLLAPFAIADASVREAALVRFSAYAIDRGRLASAREVVEHITLPSARYRALAGIATRQFREGYTLAWAATWDEAMAEAVAQPESAGRVESLQQLGLQAAQAGDVRRAEQMLSEVGADAGQGIAQALVSALTASGDFDAALARFSRLPDVPGRSRAAADLYAGLLSRGRLDQANQVLASVDTPQDKVVALLAQADYFGRTPTAPGYDASKAAASLAAARQELTRIAQPAVRDEQATAVARALAQRGDVAGIDELIALATPDGQAAMAASKVAAVARAEGAPDALTVLEGLPPAARDGGLSEIAAVLSDQQNPIAAYDTARLIGNDHARRRALRRIAEQQARAQRLRGSDTVAAVPAPRVPKDAAVSITSDQFLLKSVSLREPRALPDVLSAAKVTGEDVRRMVPPVAPGTARLVPTGFSNFDEKFSYIRYLNNVDFNGGEEEILAQGQGTLFPHFILVESGVYDLPTLKAELETADAAVQPITNDGRVYQLNVPLLIGSDATLVVTSSDVEELRLNTNAHSYIVNSGKIFIVDSKVTSWDPATAAPTPRTKRVWNEFSPFYTAWSGSETYMADAHINGMGYANGKSYGISISNGPINVLKATLNSVPRPKGVIVDSTFTDMYYAFYSYEADDFRLVGNEYRNNEIYAIDPHDRTTRLTIAYNTAVGTRVKHGIITSREVKDSVIMGNVSADNHGSGFMLDRMSDDNIVAFNLGFRNGADGLTVYESSCNLLYRNTFLRNGRDGVKLRNSWDLLVSQNQIEDNHGFGLNLYSSRIEDTPEAAHRDFKLDPYVQYANATALNNVLNGNGKSALRGADTAALIMAGNRMSADPKGLFRQSDFQRIGPSLMSLAGSGAALRDTCQPARPPVKCRFLDEGYFGDDVVGALDRETAASQCVKAVN
ncbi:MAG: right-handed parallel beta-helix repeat-containing protein [Rhizobiaceae bacterium]|nr:right-handed parallel beta-helix repeat-containing protein [Rhizobiaceae bacterium]